VAGLPGEANMDDVLSQREQREIDRANASGRTPVLFVHGLWMLPSSWDRWRGVFEQDGFTTLAPSWPDDPETVAEARERPHVFAHKHIGQVHEHVANVIRRLHTVPAIVGHSFGGLITQMLAGDGMSIASVAVDPAPFRGVLPLPISSLRAAFPVLGNPLNFQRAVPLTLPQFRYSFANAVSSAEASQLYDTYAVACSGMPLFQAATANLNPWTEARVDVRNPRRGPLLIVSGEKDNTVPWALANAAFRRQKRNAAPTEIREVPNRGHSLVIDSGWREVADLALEFIRRHTQEARAAE
jgi:pimeloyl-ACP methyl ester carboxylesterase